MTNKNNANRNDEQPLLNVLRTESFRAQLDAIVKDGLDSLDVVRLDSGLNRGLNFLEVGSIAARAFASSPLQNMNMETLAASAQLCTLYSRRLKSPERPHIWCVKFAFILAFLAAQCRAVPRHNPVFHLGFLIVHCTRLPPDVTENIA